MSDNKSYRVEVADYITDPENKQIREDLKSSNPDYPYLVITPGDVKRVKEEDHCTVLTLGNGSECHFVKLDDIDKYQVQVYLAGDLGDPVYINFEDEISTVSRFITLVKGK